jgi:hypothetical protein
MPSTAQWVKLTSIRVHTTNSGRCDRSRQSETVMCDAQSCRDHSAITSSPNAEQRSSSDWTG